MAWLFETGFLTDMHVSVWIFLMAFVVMPL